MEKIYINRFLVISYVSLVFSCSGTKIYQNDFFDKRSKNINFNRLDKFFEKNQNILKNAYLYDLVEVREMEPTIRVDLRYATKNNLIKRNIYPKNMPCLLYKNTARKLKKAQFLLKKRGVGLIVFDAYRPPESHMKLLIFTNYHPFIQHPSYGWSSHCFGRAVDLGLVDLKSGETLKMPSKYDHFGREAESIYRGNDEEIRRNNQLLKSTMIAVGMKPLINEWWHFSDVKTSDNREPIRARELKIKLPK